MRIAIASDHAGYAYKQLIIEHLRAEAVEVVDFGTHGFDAVDYPQYIRPAAEAVATGRCDRAILLGGSGNGEAMVANRIPGVRCALCWNAQTAILGRQHNDANALAIGARTITAETALQIVRLFLQTPFEGGRHVRRITQIDGPAR